MDIEYETVEDSPVGAVHQSETDKDVHQKVSEPLMLVGMTLYNRMHKVLHLSKLLSELGYVGREVHQLVHLSQICLLDGCLLFGRHGLGEQGEGAYYKNRFHVFINNYKLKMEKYRHGTHF